MTFGLLERRRRWWRHWIRTYWSILRENHVICNRRCRIRCGRCRFRVADRRLADANLYHADLRYADLTGADLIGANLHYADLSGANLTSATLY